MKIKREYKTRDKNGSYSPSIFLHTMALYLSKLWASWVNSTMGLIV
jgi:hypothetical protein